jgi:hypothetical protein
MCLRWRAGQVKSTGAGAALGGACGEGAGRRRRDSWAKVMHRLDRAGQGRTEQGRTWRGRLVEIQRPPGKVLSSQGNRRGLRGGSQGSVRPGREKRNNKGLSNDAAVSALGQL